MKRSDWITITSMIVGVFLTTIGSVVHLSYKIGGIDQKITSVEKNMEDNMKKTDNAIAEVRNDIKDLKTDVSALRVDMAEMRVKVDELWDYHLNQIKSTKTTSKTKLIAF